MLALPTPRPAAPTSPSMAGMSRASSRPALSKQPSKLKRSFDDTSSMAPPSSPSKRVRVTFDTDVDILSADEEDQLSPVVVKELVYRALQRHRLGDDESYENIRSLFAKSVDKERAPSERMLKLHLQALLSHIGLLSRDCSSLVHTLLGSDWLGRDEGYFTLFVRFMGNLVAAHAGFMNKTMEVLVNSLGPQKTRRSFTAQPVRQPKIHRRSLQTIQYITQLIPTASSSLLDKITSKLDFDFQDGEERLTYVKNFMELIRYVPELNSEILTNILRQLIKLDTAIQADLDEEEDDAEDDILHHMSTSQTLAMQASHAMLRSDLDDADVDDDVSTTDESDVDNEEDLHPEAARRKKLKEDVKQVDMIMDLLFQHYSKLTTSTTLQTRDNAIGQLIAQFRSIILPTYRSRHPQFLVFHFAQSDPIIVDRFVTSCAAVLVDKTQPPFLRHAAAAYFSGFVGRGAHVPPSVVQAGLNYLCDQLNMLRKSYEPTCRGPDIKRYGDFYSMFQAIMYIFCFRWRDIGLAASDLDDNEDEHDYDFVEEDDNGKRIEEYQFPDNLRETLHSAIYSPLNPLKVCTAAIVDQFAKLSMILQFLYIYPKIEQNKRVRLTTSWRQTSASSISSSSAFHNSIDTAALIGHAERDSSWIGENGMLEGYFPYDPYHLPMSKHWIEGDYVEWQGLPNDGAEEDSESDSEFDYGDDTHDLIDDEDDDGNTTT